MLKEKRISFEVAKLAVEKGILDIKIPSPQDFYNDEGHIYGYGASTLGINYYPVISQSLLQQWLRDSFKIHIEVRLLGNLYWIIIKDYIDKDVTSLTPRREYGGFNTYEEALEKGLQESLELI